MKRAWLRWLPAVVAPAVIAAVAVVAPLQASAAVDLPAKTPQQLLTMIGQSSVRALSGTLEQTSHLGLPQLPANGSSSAAGVASTIELLTGTHTARVYLDGPSNARIQIMDSLAERDLVRHGADLWFYDSHDNSVTHATLAADASHTQKPAAVPGAVQTPAELAQRLLAAIDPSTRVAVGTSSMVAGRTAYELVLSPRASDTLVGSVSIAVDSHTGLPLRVDIMARGQRDPAFHLAFTSLTLQAPAAGLFAFVPPPGATVKQQKLPDFHWAQKAQKQPNGSQTQARPTISGTGWDAIIELPASAVPAQLTGSPLLTEATQAVSGGRLLSTALVNVFFTQDGRVLAGSVPLARLQAAATTP